MSSKLPVLKRIEALYQQIEQMHSTALRQASVLVFEAETAITEQHIQIRNAQDTAHEALIGENREDWLIAVTQREIAARQREQLEKIRVEREIVTIRAHEVYGASRMQSEQMKSLVESSERATLLVAGRRTQASADDRFLSRLRWKSVAVD